MRTVGRRIAPPLADEACAQALVRGLELVDAAASFGWATSTGQRKGVYRFASFEAMEQHRVESLARVMAARSTA